MPSQRRPPVILFPYLLRPSFIQRDLDSIRTMFEVELVDCRRLSGILRAIGAVARSDMLVCWFGSLRYLPIAALATVLGKPICIIAGGYDVAAVPAIKYGTMARPWSRLLGRWLFARADAVAAFSTSAGKEAISNARVPGNRLTVIPLGYPDRPAPVAKKEPIVLCVSNIDQSTLLRKGLLTVARLAGRMPQFRFILAGGGDPQVVELLLTESGGHLSLPGRVEDAVLQQLFATARVYVQPSLHEGFGSAVAEAMLHDCIPVVSPLFSLPEVVGPCGLYANPSDLEALEEKVTEVLENRFIPPEAPRARILREFPAARRKDALLALLSRLLHSA